MKSFAALFPGQGSQSLGMGLKFFESDATARELFALVDARVGYPLSKLCFNGPLDELTLTQNAQPALLTVGVAAFRLAGWTPCAAAGHSLGEYAALVAASVIDFGDAVELVHKRGRYMQEAVRPGEGKMIAVLGPTINDIRTALASVDSGTVEVANLNSPGQTVLAGDIAGVDAFAARISAQGAKVIPLNVSAPFHCSLMKPAAEKLARDLDAVSFSSPKFPVYSNVTAKPVATAQEARECLKTQVCSTVRWSDSLVNLFEDHRPSHTVEFGPGGVLSNLVKRISKEIVRLEVFDPESLSKARTGLS